MPPYFMWDSDIEKMAKLVMAKKVFVKSMKSAKKVPVLMGVEKACQIEKKHRLIKNEFMHYFHEKPLRCKTLKEASYSEDEYVKAATEYKVSKATIEMWYDKVIKDPTRECFFMKLGFAFSPSNKEDDFPTILRILFKHQKVVKENQIQAAPTSSRPMLSAMYKCSWMNRKSGDVAKMLILESNEMLLWIKKDAAVVLVYCFVNRKEKGNLDYFSIYPIISSLYHTLSFSNFLVLGFHYALLFKIFTFLIFFPYQHPQQIFYLLNFFLIICLPYRTLSFFTFSFFFPISLFLSFSFFIHIPLSF